jgi:hypothetical protein
MPPDEIDEARFHWVTVDAASILGEARPKTVEELLKKKQHVWRQLYRDWLTEFHWNQVEAFEFLEPAGDPPAPAERNACAPYLAALAPTFPRFYSAAGELKEALDSRTGAARRLGRLAGKAGTAVQRAASSTVAREVAGATGTRSVRRATDAVAQQVTRATAPKRAQAPLVPAPPPRPEPPNLNEFAVSTAWAVYEFLGSEHLSTYVSWGWQLVGQLEWFGGEVGAHLARISALMEEVAGWRQNAQAGAEGLQAALATGPPPALPEAIKAARESAYGLAYYLDLLGYIANGEAPHQTVGRVVDDLAQQQAFYLVAMVADRLGELLRGFDALYFHACGALDTAAAVFRLEDPHYHADNLTDWGRPQAVTLRAEVTEVMRYLESLPWAEEPYEPEEALAVRYFGRSLADL